MLALSGFRRQEQNQIIQCSQKIRQPSSGERQSIRTLTDELDYLVLEKFNIKENQNFLHFLVHIPAMRGSYNEVL